VRVEEHEGSRGSAMTVVAIARRRDEALP
jgi:hypothetical protein